MSLASGDLTTLATVSTYYGTGGPSAAMLGGPVGLISRLSRWVLNELNRPFILPKTYVEYFNGSGTRQLVLPNWPVLSLSSVTVDTVTLNEAQISNNVFYDTWGWNVQPWNGVPPGEPLVIGLSGGASFWPGSRSVAISYLAGYQVSSEAATIPVATGPYHVTPIQPYGSWASDRGVTYSDGTALVAISSGTPTIGQYLPPAPDLATPRLYYTFAAADAGRGVLLSYGFVPGDLEQVVLELILERSAYRTRPGVRSQSIAAQESISYDTSGLSAVSSSIISAYKSVLPPAMGAFV